MLIKEVSEDIAVIVVNNNKVPNFPLKKALWNVCGSCSHYKTLAMGMFFWSCSSCCSPHGNGFALFAFYFIFIFFFSCMVPSVHLNLAGLLLLDLLLLRGQGEITALLAFSSSLSSACCRHGAICGTFRFPGERWRMWNSDISKTFRHPALPLTATEGPEVPCIPVLGPPTADRHLSHHILSTILVCRHLNTSRSVWHDFAPSSALVRPLLKSVRVTALN